MDGGAELIGTNHPLWNQYQQRFGLTFLDNHRGGRRSAHPAQRPPLDRGGVRAALERHDRRARRAQSRRGAIPDPLDALDGRERRGARSPLARRMDRGRSPISPLCRVGIDAQMTADNGMTDGLAELSRQPRHDQGRRRREVLDRDGGLSMRGRHPAAGAARWPASSAIACVSAPARLARSPRRDRGVAVVTKAARRTRRTTSCSRCRR